MPLEELFDQFFQVSHGTSCDTECRSREQVLFPIERVEFLTQSLFQVGDQVIALLDADADSNKGITDSQ